MINERLLVDRSYTCDWCKTHEKVVFEKGHNHEPISGSSKGWTNINHTEGDETLCPKCSQALTDLRDACKDDAPVQDETKDDSTGKEQVDPSQWLQDVGFKFAPTDVPTYSVQPYIITTSSDTLTSK